MRAFVCLAGCLLLAGCMSPARLELSPSAKAARPRTDGPVVCLSPLVDGRNNPDEMGQIGGRRIVADEVAGWVEGEFRALVATQFQITEDVGGEHVGTLRPTLIKLYGNSHATSKMAVVVIQVEWTPRNGEGGWRRLYRGQKAGINWSSGTGEFETLVRNAMQDSLRKLDADLRVAME